MEQQNNQVKNSVEGKVKIISGVIIGAFILFVVMFAFRSEESQIMKIAEEGIREGLKYNADEAEFSPKSENEIFFYGDDEEYVSVSGWVIAYNGYGAKSKVAYEAELEKNEAGKWEFDYFELEDEYEDEEW